MPPATSHITFAYAFSILLLILVVLGFGARAILLPEYWPPVRATLIIHILVTGGWFILAVFQANLVREKNIKQHMAFGRYGVVLAVLVVFTGTLMIFELNLREFSWLQVASNSVNMVTFAIFFGAAILWRRDGRAHKRMILFASLALMSPAIARLMQPLGAEVLTHPIWLLLCVAVAAFDLRSEARVTRATWFGLLISLLGFGVFGAAAVLTAGSANAQAIDAGPLSDPNGYTGRIRLVRFLDEPDGYCIDVPGGGDRVLLNMPAIAHTCHFDPLPDQVFSFNTDGQGRIVWAGKDEQVCLTAQGVRDGEGFLFASCGDPSAQTFSFERGGALMLADSDLCLSVERTGPSFRETLGDGQDAYGRGRPVNPQYTHLARALILAPCGVGDPSMQRWQAYDE